MYKRCIIICLILLLSIQMYGCKSDVENEKCETNVQYDTECSKKDQPEMTDRKLQTEDTEASEELTKREALDLVFAHYTDSTDEMFDLSFFEMKDGKIGYSWKWENTQDSPVMFLTETHSIVKSKGDSYLFFRLYNESHEGAIEVFQEYAINLKSGQIIDERVYDESGQWEYSVDYSKYILERDSGLQPKDTETPEKLTKRETLDTLYNYLYGDGKTLLGVAFFDDEVIGYEWSHRSLDVKTYLCEYYVTKDENYLIFELYSELYDAGGEFIRTELLNYYAVDLHSGEVIPWKLRKNEDEMWEPNVDFIWTRLLVWDKVQIMRSIIRY